MEFIVRDRYSPETTSFKVVMFFDDTVRTFKERLENALVKAHVGGYYYLYFQTRDDGIHGVYNTVSNFPNETATLGKVVTRLDTCVYDMANRYPWGNVPDNFYDTHEGYERMFKDFRTNRFFIWIVADPGTVEPRIKPEFIEHYFTPIVQTTHILSESEVKYIKDLYDYFQAPVGVQDTVYLTHITCVGNLGEVIDIDELYELFDVNSVHTAVVNKLSDSEVIKEIFVPLVFKLTTPEDAFETKVNENFFRNSLSLVAHLTKRTETGNSTDSLPPYSTLVFKILKDMQIGEASSVDDFVTIAVSYNGFVKIIMNFSDTNFSTYNIIMDEYVKPLLISLGIYKEIEYVTKIGAEIGVDDLGMLDKFEHVLGSRFPSRSHLVDVAEHHVANKEIVTDMRKMITYTRVSNHKNTEGVYEKLEELIRKGLISVTDKDTPDGKTRLRDTLKKEGIQLSHYNAYIRNSAVRVSDLSEVQLIVNRDTNRIIVRFVTNIAQLFEILCFVRVNLLFLRTYTKARDDEDAETMAKFARTGDIEWMESLIEITCSKQNTRDATTILQYLNTVNHLIFKENKYFGHVRGQIDQNPKSFASKISTKYQPLVLYKVRNPASPTVSFTDLKNVDRITPLKQQIMTMITESFNAVRRVGRFAESVHAGSFFDEQDLPLIGQLEREAVTQYVDYVISNICQLVQQLYEVEADIRCIGTAVEFNFNTTEPQMVAMPYRFWNTATQTFATEHEYNTSKMGGTKSVIVRPPPDSMARTDGHTMCDFKFCTAEEMVKFFSSLYLLPVSSEVKDKLSNALCCHTLMPLNMNAVTSEFVLVNLTTGARQIVNLPKITMSGILAGSAKPTSSRSTILSSSKTKMYSESKVVKMGTIESKYLEEIFPKTFVTVFALPDDGTLVIDKKGLFFGTLACACLLNAENPLTLLGDVRRTSKSTASFAEEIFPVSMNAFYSHVIRILLSVDTDKRPFMDKYFGHNMSRLIKAANVSKPEKLVELISHSQNACYDLFFDIMTYHGVCKPGYHVNLFIFEKTVVTIGSIATPRYELCVPVGYDLQSMYKISPPGIIVLNLVIIDYGGVFQVLTTKIKDTQEKKYLFPMSVTFESIIKKLQAVKSVPEDLEFMQPGVIERPIPATFPDIRKALLETRKYRLSSIVIHEYVKRMLYIGVTEGVRKCLVPVFPLLIGESTDVRKRPNFAGIEVVSVGDRLPSGKLVALPRSNYDLLLEIASVLADVSITGYNVSKYLIDSTRDSDPSEVVVAAVLLENGATVELDGELKLPLAQIRGKAAPFFPYHYTDFLLSLSTPVPREYALEMEHYKDELYKMMKFTVARLPEEIRETLGSSTTEEAYAIINEHIKSQSGIDEEEFKKLLMARPKLFILDTCKVGVDNVFCMGGKLTIKHDLYDTLMRRLLFDLQYNRFISNEILSGNVSRRNHFYDQYVKDGEIRLVADSVQSMSDAIQEVSKERNKDPLTEILDKTYMI